MLLSIPLFHFQPTNNDDALPYASSRRLRRGCPFPDVGVCFRSGWYADGSQGAGVTARFRGHHGRPSKRGRVLFNGLGDMKWGMVWRTGANEATHFTTSKPLAFGAITVPAGTYTLFTKIEENGKWELVVNKQTKQWGTAYDAKQDLVRIPMTVTSNNAVVEKMEIMVKPAGKGGELIVAWDTYKAVAAFTAK